MRLFAALDPPSRVRDQCRTFQKDVSLDARWTSPEQLHVTLRFMGDAAANQAAQYSQALALIDTPPVRCAPRGTATLDVFPSRRNPSVLVVALERTDSLMALYEAVSQALESEGLPPEDRTYQPHLTVARLDDAPADAVHKVVQAHQAFSIDSFVADAFHLYESTLTPEGAIHDRRASFSLSPA